MQSSLANQSKEKVVRKVTRYSVVFGGIAAVLFIATEPAVAENLCPVGGRVIDNVLKKPATVIAATEQSCRIKYLDNGKETWVEQWQLVDTHASSSARTGAPASKPGERKTYCMWTKMAGYTVCQRTPCPEKGTCG